MKDLSKDVLEKIKAGKALTFEELQPVFRPEGVQNGLLKVDPDKCKSCALCVQNCPFKCWEMGENKIPRLKKDYKCFSCFNCMVACPTDAISIVSHYKSEGGYWDTGFPPVKTPLEPRDADDKPAEWTDLERLILNRRSVRNFKDTPVPEPLIRRILEAGRFAPSAGNHQPWKFTVVTDRKFIAELEEVAYQVNSGLYNLFVNDATTMQAYSIVGGTLPASVFDWRVMMGGFGAIVKKDLPIYLNAPCVIFIGSNRKLAGPEMQVGICAENMALTAIVLGLGGCMSNFGREVNNIPELREKLGFTGGWEIMTTLCVGYPKFKQSGMVPRMFRPVTWFRSGSNKPQIEE